MAQELLRESSPDTVLGDLFEKHIVNLRKQSAQLIVLPDIQESNIVKLNVFQLSEPKLYAAGLWYASVIVSQHEAFGNGPDIYPLTRDLVDQGIATIVMDERYGGDFDPDSLEMDSPEYIAWSSFVKDISGKSSEELTSQLLFHMQRFDV